MSAPRAAAARGQVLAAATGTRRNLAAVVAPVALGFLVVGLILLADARNPLAVLGAAVGDAVFTRSGLLQTLSGAAPLTLTALTFAVGFRCGLFNISAEGATMMGAAATIAIGGLIELPRGVHLLAVVAGSAAAGLLWSLPIAYLKTRREVHEVVSTIMTNYVAMFLLGFLVAWPLRDSGSAFGTFAVEVRPSARFPVVAGPLTGAILLGVAAAILAYYVMGHTRAGAHIRATGYNIEAARHAGIRTAWMMSLSFGGGGAIAGLAGCALTAGLPPDWTVNDDLSALTGIGYLGIAVAMIGRNHPLGCLVAALFVSGIRTSRSSVQQMGIAPEITDILMGVVILAFAVPEAHTLVLDRLRAARKRDRSLHESAA